MAPGLCIQFVPGLRGRGLIADLFHRGFHLGPLVVTVPRQDVRQAGWTVEAAQARWEQMQARLEHLRDGARTRPGGEEHPRTGDRSPNND